MLKNLISEITERRDPGPMFSITGIGIVWFHIFFIGFGHIWTTKILNEGVTQLNSFMFGVVLLLASLGILIPIIFVFFLAYNKFVEQIFTGYLIAFSLSFLVILATIIFYMSTPHGEAFEQTLKKLNWI